MRWRVMLSVVSLGLATALSHGQAADAAAVIESSERYADQVVVEIEQTPEAEAVAEQIALERFEDHCHAHGLTIRTMRHSLSKLDAISAEYVLVIPDLQAAIRAQVEPSAQETLQRLSPAGTSGLDFTAYPNPSQIDTALDNLVAAYPDLLTEFVVGISIEGRDIRGLRISTDEVPGSKPVVAFTGCLHAREWISPVSVLYTLEQLLDGYGANPRVTEILNNVDVVIIPLANPDGYQYTWSTDRLWRKNRRNNGNGTFGVDLNRNWSFQWGGAGSSGTTSSNLYRGTGAFSEPETAALSTYLSNLPNLAGHIDVHSWGQLIMAPWNYTTSAPPAPEGPWMLDLGIGMREAMIAGGGNTYDAGTGGSLLYLFAGSMPDWVYGVLGVPSYTIELRPNTSDPGFLLPPSQILPTASELWDAIQHFLERVAAPVDASLISITPNPEVVGEVPTLAITFGTSSNPFVPAQQVTGSVFTRTDGNAPFVGRPLEPVGGGQYRAAIPAPRCTQTLSFYAAFGAPAAATVVEPGGGADQPLIYVVDPLVVLEADDMEADAGWTVGAPGDTASDGIWERVDPQATASQPESDTTIGGTRCWVTNGFSDGFASRDDVDGGATTLTSPDLPATPPPGRSTDDIVLEFDLWYSNDLNGNVDDSFVVQVSADGGQAWFTLAEFTQSTSGWERQRLFPGAALPSIADTFRVRFVASDTGLSSIVEAAIDELIVQYEQCPTQCAGDIAVPIGELEAGDINAFTAYASAGDRFADIALPEAVIDFFDFAEQQDRAANCP